MPLLDGGRPRRLEHELPTHVDLTASRNSPQDAALDGVGDLLGCVRSRRMRYWSWRGASRARHDFAAAVPVERVPISRACQALSCMCPRRIRPRITVHRWACPRPSMLSRGAARACRRRRPSCGIRHTLADSCLANAEVPLAIDVALRPWPDRSWAISSRAAGTEQDSHRVRRAAPTSNSPVPGARLSTRAHRRSSATNSASV